MISAPSPIYILGCTWHHPDDPQCLSQNTTFGNEVFLVLPGVHLEFSCVGRAYIWLFGQQHIHPHPESLLPAVDQRC
jgi:hypothetical protein